MKIFKKIVCILLALILLAAGGLWFKCRVIDHRSFMAGVADLVLIVQRRSEKFRDIDVCNSYIESREQENREPVVIEKAKFGVSLTEEETGEEGLQAFVYNAQDSPSVTVFYFHGGAYINQPNSQQTTMAARTAAETGAEVVLVVYPKEPVYTCSYAYESFIRYYTNRISGKDPGKVVFMGDSAGGGLALGLAMELRDRRETVPSELVLISPWVDVTMSDPEMPEYLKNDPMLGIDGCRRMGECWAGELDMTDPRVSPIYGDVSGDWKVTLTAGTWEVLYPDIMKLYDRFTESSTECELIVGERMIHCYPIVPVPEAGPAREKIWEAVTR